MDRRRTFLWVGVARIVAAVLAIAFMASAATAEKRFALVMGNADYRVGKLKNPTSDARLITRTLEDVGFEVTTVRNATRRQMKSAVHEFTQKVQSSSGDTVALFFFAGHGIQLDGRNFLIPIDAKLDSAVDLEYEAVEAQWALDRISAANPKTTIFVLDACRNNPFRSLGRSTSRGLAQMETAQGAILGFATGPGKVARDGVGANSPYSSALARAISTPGLKVEEVFKQVRRSVFEATDGAQTPWESTSLLRDFYFSKAARPVATQPVIVEEPTPAPKKSEPQVAIADPAPRVVDPVASTGAPPFAAICGETAQSSKYDLETSRVSMADAYKKSTRRWGACPNLLEASDGECIAIAESNKGAWSWRVRTGEEAAKKAALDGCLKYSSSCRVKRSLCTGAVPDTVASPRSGTQGRYAAVCGVGSHPGDYAVAFSDDSKASALLKAKRLWPECPQEHAIGPGRCISIAVQPGGHWNWRDRASEAQAIAASKKKCAESNLGCEIVETFCTNP